MSQDSVIHVYINRSPPYGMDINYLQTNKRSNVSFSTCF